MIKRTIKPGLPWYRYWSVWIFLIVGPSLVVIGSTLVFYIAIHSVGSQPYDSYLKKGLSPYEVTPREVKAKKLNLSAILQVTQNKILIDFNHPPTAKDLVVTFQHPILEKKDFTIPLIAVSGQASHFYLIRPKNLRDNKWDILVDSPSQQWRIKGRLLKQEKRLELAPFNQ
ncbi:MAG: FixH family protein [Ostreibacterium sp.]